MGRSAHKSGPEGRCGEGKGSQAALRLCAASPAPPWQGGLTPAAHQSTHFVPVPLNPPLKFTALSESFPFIQQWTFVPAALAPPAPGCVYSSANTSKPRCSFFWPYLLPKATVFMKWGYVKEQSSFSLQQSCHCSSLIQGGISQLCRAQGKFHILHLLQQRLS